MKLKKIIFCNINIDFLSKNFKVVRKYEILLSV